MEEDEVELRDYINVLVKRKRLIIVITLIAVLISGLLSYFVLPKVYEATVTFLVANPNIVTSTTNPPSALEQATNPLTYIPNTSVVTYSNLVTSPSFLKNILQKVNAPEDLTPETLAKNINVTTPFDKTSSQSSNLIIVNVDLPDRELSYNIAKAIADEFPKYAQDLNKVDTSSVISAIEGQIQEAEKDLEAKEKAYKDSLAFFISDIVSISKQDLQQKEAAYLDAASKLASDELNLALEDLSKTTSGSVSQYTSEILDSAKQDLQQKEAAYLDAASKLATDELNLALENLLKATNEYQAFLASEDNITVLTKEIDVALSNFAEYQDTLSKLQISIETTHAKLSDLINQISKESQFITLTQSVADSPFLTQLVSDNPNFKELVHLQMESTQLNPLYQQLSSQISTLQATLAEITQQQITTQKISEDTLKKIYDLQKQLADKKVKLEELEKNLDLANSDYSQAFSHYKDYDTMLSLSTGGLLSRIPSLKTRQEQLVSLKRELDKARANYDIAFSRYKDRLEELQRSLDLPKENDFSIALSHYKDYDTMLSLSTGGLLSRIPSLKTRQEQLVSLKRELDKARANYDIAFSIFKDNSILENIDIGGLISLDPTLRDEQLKYLSMKRELDLAQNKYNLLKQSYNEAKILGTMNMQNLKLALEPIMPEKPVKPNKKLNIAIAGVAALFFSILLAFFLEYMENTENNKKEAKA
jgi:capsular polysaccharide biosynthesis protein